MAIQELSTQLSCLNYFSGRKRSVHVKPKGFSCIECTNCSKKFTSWAGYTKHISAYHDKSEPFKCQVCSKTFGSSFYLRKHTSAVHDRLRLNKCPQCPKVFSYSSGFTRHFRLVHDKNEPFKCTLCSKNFGAMYLLSKHLKAVHENVSSWTCHNILFSLPLVKPLHSNSCQVWTIQPFDFNVKVLWIKQEVFFTIFSTLLEQA